MVKVKAITSQHIIQLTACHFSRFLILCVTIIIGVGQNISSELQNSDHSELWRNERQSEVWSVNDSGFSFLLQTAIYHQHAIQLTARMTELLKGWEERERGRQSKRDLKTGQEYERLQNNRNRNVATLWGKSQERDINHGRNGKSKKQNMRSREWQTDMNDTCEEGCHTDTQQFMFMGQLLLLSPLPVLRVCEFQMYPFPFLAASQLSTHLTTHSSRANKKREALCKCRGWIRLWC